MRPINLDEADARGLFVHHPAKGILTFSNGSEWDGWASRNCWQCRFYDANAAGKDCAFEAAAFLHGVSPDLARLFGWTDSAEYTGYFDKPDECPFFRDRDEDGDNPPPPDPDPLQLVLLADPTEDAAIIQNAPIDVRELVEATVLQPSRRSGADD